MWRVMGIGVTAVALCGSSAAASESDWTGIYFGANVGHGWSDYSSNIAAFDNNGALFATGPLGYSVDFDGPFAGGQIGYNHNLGGLVLGVEVDFQGSDIDGQSTTPFPAPPVVFPFTYEASTDINWFGTVRGRIGLICDRTLFYFTGGYAYGDVDYNANYLFTTVNANAPLHKSGTQDGYVLGGGVEHLMDKNWSLKLEYQYLDLGHEDVSGGSPAQWDPPPTSS